LEARESALLAAHKEKWARPVCEFLSGGDPGRLAAEIEHTTFHRGFIEVIMICVDDFVRHADKLFHLEPVQEVILWHAADFQNQTIMVELAGCPHLARVIELNFRMCGIDSASLAALAASPYLTRVQEIDLFENEELGIEGVKALVTS